MEQNKVEGGKIQEFGVYQAGFLQTQSYIGTLEAQAQEENTAVQTDRQTDRRTASPMDFCRSIPCWGAWADTNGPRSQPCPGPEDVIPIPVWSKFDW